MKVWGKTDIKYHKSIALCMKFLNKKNCNLGKINKVEIAISIFLFRLIILYRYHVWSFAYTFDPNIWGSRLLANKNPQMNIKWRADACCQLSVWKQHFWLQSVLCSLLWAHKTEVCYKHYSKRQKNMEAMEGEIVENFKWFLDSLK